EVLHRRGRHVCRRAPVMVARQDLFLVQAAAEHLEDVNHANAHPANAGMSVALIGADRDAAEEVMNHRPHPTETRLQSGDGSRMLLAPYPPWGCGWIGSTQYTASGGSAGAMSRLTTTGSWPLRTSTHSSGSLASALISW